MYVERLHLQTSFFFLPQNKSNFINNITNLGIAGQINPIIYGPENALRSKKDLVLTFESNEKFYDQGSTEDLLIRLSFK